MTTTPFDLAAAKKTAATKATEAIVLSAGGASNRFDTILLRLIDDPSLDVADKIQKLQLIENNIALMVAAAVEGKKPRALASSSSAKSGDEDSDLTEQLEKAKSRIDTLLANQKTLLDAVRKATGEAVNLVDDSVPSSTPSDVEKAVKDKVDRAKADATPKDVVDKAAIAAEVADLEKLIKDEKLDNRHLAVVQLKTVSSLVDKAKALVAKVK